MRLFTKLYFCIIAAFGAAFLTSGYFLLGYSLESGVERELAFALRQYQYDRFAVQAGMLEQEELLESGARTGEWIMPTSPARTSSEFLESGTRTEDADEADADGRDQREVYARILRQVSGPACILDEDGAFLARKGIEAGTVPVLSLQEDAYSYQVSEGESENGGAEPCIYIGSRIEQDGLRLGLVTRTELTQTLARQEILKQYFERFFCAALAVGALLSAGISLFLTAPIKRMTRAADRMAKGCCHERLPVRGSDELAELAESFNRMAGAVEQTVDELSAEAERKEDFVENFAHELKSPLTSIIGYADRIYRKELPREETRQAAWYIWDEGMRLEALAVKLMDLTNLNRQEIPLVRVSARELLQDIVQGLEPVFAEKGVRLSCTAREGEIRADYDLLKSLLLNLIDNAAKAGASEIRVTGEDLEGRYRIAVSDDGRGIPEAELPRITEAFYTVDKSRSRRQHGAGLGLALAERIAALHGGRIEIRSRAGEGTQVLVELPGVAGDDTEEFDELPGEEKPDRRIFTRQSAEEEKSGQTPAEKAALEEPARQSSGLKRDAEKGGRRG